MDVILTVADHLVLDSVWAQLVPLPQQTHLACGPSPPWTNWLSNVAELLPATLRPPAISCAQTLNHPLVSSYPSLSTTAGTISAWPREYIVRQVLSVTTLTIIGIVALYLVFASVSYYFIFDHRMMRHPRFLKNQVKLEIMCSLWSLPGITLLTLPWFMGEVRGYSRLYSNVEDYGFTYLVLSVPLFLLFTDYCIYWIHRWLHLPFLYKHIHKPHHKWIVPTPFASHAFHPVDGYSQSVPYHLFVFVFPMHRYLYLGLFVMVNFWSIFIHDSDMFVSSGSHVEKYINTPAHHTLHHIYFTCNYGQYFTWADRTGGSYRAPQSELDPLLEVLAQSKQDNAHTREANGTTVEGKKSK